MDIPEEMLRVMLSFTGRATFTTDLIEQPGVLAGILKHNQLIRQRDPLVVRLLRQLIPPMNRSRDEQLLALLAELDQPADVAREADVEVGLATLSALAVFLWPRATEHQQEVHSEGDRRRRYGQRSYFSPARHQRSVCFVSVHLPPCSTSTASPVAVSSRRNGAGQTVFSSATMSARGNSPAEATVTSTDVLSESA